MLPQRDRAHQEARLARYQEHIQIAQVSTTERVVQPKALRKGGLEGHRNLLAGRGVITSSPVGKFAAHLLALLRKVRTGPDEAARLVCSRLLPTGWAAPMLGTGVDRSGR